MLQTARRASTARACPARAQVERLSAELAKQEAFRRGLLQQLQQLQQEGGGDGAGAGAPPPRLSGGGGGVSDATERLVRQVLSSCQRAGAPQITSCGGSGCRSRSPGQAVHERASAAAAAASSGTGGSCSQGSTAAGGLRPPGGGASARLGSPTPAARRALSPPPGALAISGASHGGRHHRWQPGQAPPPAPSHVPPSPQPLPRPPSPPRAPATRHAHARAPPAPAAAPPPPPPPPPVEGRAFFAARRAALPYAAFSGLLAVVKGPHAGRAGRAGALRAARALLGGSTRRWRHVLKRCSRADEAAGAQGAGRSA